MPAGRLLEAPERLLELARLHVVGVADERRVFPAAIGRIGAGLAKAAETRLVGVGDALRGERRRERRRPNWGSAGQPGALRTSTSSCTPPSRRIRRSSSSGRVE